MRFLMSIIWALLIGSVLAYVLTSMADAAFNFTQAIILSAIVFIAVLILDSGVIRDLEN